jgi:hypothetical protein
VVENPSLGEPMDLPTDIQKDFIDEIINSWDMEAPELLPAGSTEAVWIREGRWMYAIPKYFWREGENLDIP